MAHATIWLKRIFLALLALYFAKFFFNADLIFPSLLHGFVLIIHEAGHVFMAPFGRFFMFLGGSLWQIAIPALICVYFALTKQRYSAAVTLFLVGFSFLDVAVYAGDASARALPLITNDAGTHDWWNLLRMLDLLEYDWALSRLFYLEGLACYLAALFFGARYSGRIEIKS